MNFNINYLAVFRLETFLISRFWSYICELSLLNLLNAGNTSTKSSKDQVIYKIQIC